MCSIGGVVIVCLFMIYKMKLDIKSMKVDLALKHVETVDAQEEPKEIVLLESAGVRVVVRDGRVQLDKAELA